MHNNIISLAEIQKVRTEEQNAGGYHNRPHGQSTSAAQALLQALMQDLMCDLEQKTLDITSKTSGETFKLPAYYGKTL